MSSRSRTTSSWVIIAFVLGAGVVWAHQTWFGRLSARHGVESRSGFVMLEADRRKSKAYLNFIYGVLYQERGQIAEAAERFAEACSLDQILQTNMEPEQNPS